jgi:hypothetical protein
MLQRYAVHVAVLAAPLAAIAGGATVAACQTSVATRSLQLDLRLATGSPQGNVVSAVSDLEVSQDGTIYVLQPEERLIRVFDSRGQMTRTIGRSGKGPGEFRWPMRLGWKSDTLWAWDGERIGLFTRQGKFIRFVAVGTMGSVRLLRDGTIAVKRYDEDALPRKLGGGLSAPILRYDTTGKILDTIADIGISPAGAFLFEFGSGKIQGTQPFADGPLWAASPTGSTVVVVHRSSAWKPGSASFIVTKLGLAGDTIFSKSYAYEARPVTSEMVSAMVSQWVERLNLSAGGREGKPSPDPKSIERAIDRPQTLPPVTAVAVGDDETIWLRRDEDGIQPFVTWTVLDAHGAIVRTVKGPPQLRVVRARENAVWGVEKDASGVASVVVRYLVK